MYHNILYSITQQDEFIDNLYFAVLYLQLTRTIKIYN